MAKVLVSDPITPAGIDLFKQAGFEVEVKTDHTKEELIAKIKNYDALIVRSQTKVSADIIEAANNLKVIGEPVWARYNPPFTPWFLRRNEILIPIASE